jgi:predicted nucleic acid-binding protein
VAAVLVDSNVLLDVITEDTEWADWSSAELERAAASARLVINPIIYAEVSVGFDLLEDLDAALPSDYFERRPLPWAAGFLAGKCFLHHKRSGGGSTNPLPDFYIGAHAAIEGLTLLTRDPRRYRRYFPKLTLLAP